MHLLPICRKFKYCIFLIVLLVPRPNYPEKGTICVILFLLFAVDADEIKRLGKRFRKLDLDNSGSLSVDEFMTLPELQQNPLVQRVIDIFDTDGNGEVDFKGKLVLHCISVVPWFSLCKYGHYGLKLAKAALNSLMYKMSGKPLDASVRFEYCFKMAFFFY